MLGTAAFFSDFLFRHPVLPPFESPVYSNAAFQILSYALENITGTSFQSLFQRSLIEALKLNATSYALPASSNSSVIPGKASLNLYGADLRDGAPFGGYYSTINDIRKVGISILNSTFLTPAQTRKWMKPAAFLPESNQAVGAPWEIIRAPANSPMWIYTKEGDIGAYTTLVGFIPGLDVGFTILTAGPLAHPVTLALADTLTDAFVPALQTAAKDEADSVYAGTYSDAASNSSLRVSTSASQPGLVVSDFFFKGTDVAELLGALLGVNTTTEMVTVHLFPTGLQSDGGTIVSWRAAFAVVPPSVTGPGAFSSACWAWSGVDASEYAGIAFDDFTFHLSADGTRSLSIEPRALRLSLRKEAS